MSRFLFIILSLVFFPVAVSAQCANPPAEMGVLIMNKAHKVMQYCNGDDWVGLWGGRAESGDTTPAGAIMAFDLADCPDGWSPYALSSGRFLRGRCIAGETCHDPDGVRMAGVTQGDAIRNITGTLVLSNPNQGGSGAFATGYLGVGNANSWNHQAGAQATFDASRVVPTAGENRPINVAVLYCRKN